jgi:hypothetical protein
MSLRCGARLGPASFFMPPVAEFEQLDLFPPANAQPTAAPIDKPAREPEVLTFREFTARRGYDVEISHDRLRFPHGISKRQAASNRKAARHHLGEALRAARDYAAAVAEGEVRPPTAEDESFAKLLGHPDHESVKATWRVQVKRRLRLDPALNAHGATLAIIREKLDGADPWADEFGVVAVYEESLAAARLRWMQFPASA